MVESMEVTIQTLEHLVVTATMEMVETLDQTRAAAVAAPAPAAAPLAAAATTVTEGQVVTEGQGMVLVAALGVRRRLANAVGGSDVGAEAGVPLAADSVGGSDVGRMHVGEDDSISYQIGLVVNNIRI